MIGKPNSAARPGAAGATRVPDLTWWLVCALAAPTVNVLTLFVVANDTGVLLGGLVLLALLLGMEAALLAALTMGDIRRRAGLLALGIGVDVGVSVIGLCLIVLTAVTVTGGFHLPPPD